MKTLTHQRLRTLLSFDPETGAFTWRRTRAANARAGSLAGRLDSYGYRQIEVDGGLVLAHRLAWFYVHGRWPESQVDHVNGVRDDNRIGNLREADGSANQQNVSKRRGTTSKYLGVTWHAASKRWHAKIQHKGRRHSLGYHDTEEAAHAAYLSAKARIHEFNPVPRDGASTNGSSA